MSDEVLAENFGVSSRTISRSLKALEDRGFICRNTKNAKGGRERHITANIGKINEYLSKDKMSVDDKETKESQETKCPLTKDKLSVDNRQNDFIKDKGIDKEKDKINECCQGQPSVESQKQEEIEGSKDNPIIVSKEWLLERHNELTQCANGLFYYNNKFYRM